MSVPGHPSSHFLSPGPAARLRPWPNDLAIKTALHPQRDVDVRSSYCCYSICELVNSLDMGVALA